MRRRLRLGLLVLAAAGLRALFLRERLDVARGEADLLVVPIDLDDPRPHRLADVEELVELLLAVALDLRDVREPFHALGHLDEEPEVGDLRDVADDFVADAVRLREVVPLVRQELLDRQRQALVLAVDVDHARLHRVALLQHLVRMLEAAVPRHVGDVDQAVDPLLHFDEGAEVGEVADAARDHGADRIALRDRVPRVLLERLQRQRDAAVRHVDVGDDGLDFVAHVEQLRRPHLLRPRHLGDVDQPFDALFELDEGAVVGERDDAAAHLGAERVALDDVGPGVLSLLLVAEGDALGGGIELEDEDFDLVADVEVFGWMVDAAPGDVGDVQQAVDAAEVDEDAVVGDVLDDAVGELPFLQAPERLRLLRFLLDFEDGPARKDDVVPLLVEGDDLELVLVAAQGVEVLDRLGVDERSGEEGLDAADVDGEAALDAVGDAAADRLLVLVRGLDLVPDPHARRFFAREDDVAGGIFEALDEDFDVVARLDLDLAVVPGDFAHGEQPLGLGAAVDDAVGGRQLEHASADDLPFGDVRFLIEAEKLVHAETFQVVVPERLFLVVRIVT